MRLLMWHCDHFRSEVTEKGRSPVREDGEKITDVAECILVYAACEKTDEANPLSVAAKGVAEVAKHLKQLKVDTVVLHSFAHLFVELSAPQVALDVLKDMERQLAEQGFRVARTPFGWFHELTMKAKGHPLSRVARQLAP
jgi:hypothetical protein